MQGFFSLRLYVAQVPFFGFLERPNTPFLVHSTSVRKLAYCMLCNTVVVCCGPPLATKAFLVAFGDLVSHALLGQISSVQPLPLPGGQAFQRSTTIASPSFPEYIWATARTS
jgi:hypothetical protein